MKRVTIIDIATALGVTPSTVSRALSGSSRVSEETRRRVREMAEKLGYQPNVVAASLRKGRSDTIGMLVPRINRHFFSHVISAVEEVLNPAGFNLLIVQSHEKLEKEIQAIEVFIKNRVAGIIMSHSLETLNYDHMIRATRLGVPLVQFDRVIDLVPGPRIINDNFTGGHMAVKHLIKSGYTAIGHLTGSLKVNVYHQRYMGYKYALDDASISFRDDWVFENSITQESGYESTLVLLEKGEVDAIFCAGDYSAIGAIQAIESVNLKVPDDIGVIGFANEPFAGLLTPKLTSVEQNAYDMGHTTAQALINAINSKHSFSHEELIPVRLLVRASSIKGDIQKFN